MNDHPLSSSSAALTFLEQRFRGRYEDDGALRLPRLDLVSSRGPLHNGSPVSYGKLLLCALKALGENQEITDLQVGGYTRGLEVYTSSSRRFIIGDAFVIGDEPLHGDHEECAMCAYQIVEEITGLDRTDLEMIRHCCTTSVTLNKSEEAWWDLTYTSKG